jgi:hypothetical protein
MKKYPKPKIDRLKMRFRYRRYDVRVTPKRSLSESFEVARKTYLRKPGCSIVKEEHSVNKRSYDHLTEHPRDLLSARCGTTFEPVWVVTILDHHSYVYFCER